MVVYERNQDHKIFIEGVYYSISYFIRTERAAFKEARLHTLVRRAEYFIKLQEGSPSPTSSNWEDSKGLLEASKPSISPTRATLIMAIDKDAYSSLSSSEDERKKRGSRFMLERQNRKMSTTVGTILQQH